MSFVRVCAVAAAIAAVAASASGSQVSVTGTLHPTIALAGERVALSATVVGYAAAVVTVQWTPTNATRSPVLVRDTFRLFYLFFSLFFSPLPRGWGVRTVSPPHGARK